MSKTEKLHHLTVPPNSITSPAQLWNCLLLLSGLPTRSQSSVALLSLTGVVTELFCALQASSDVGLSL